MTFCSPLWRSGIAGTCHPTQLLVLFWAWSLMALHDMVSSGLTIVSTSAKDEKLSFVI